MSSRVLRKLQGDKIGELLKNDKGSDSESELDISSGTKRKQLNINRFDLLTQPSHSESEVKEDDDHETEAALPEDQADEVKDSSRRKKKKKKRRKAETKSFYHRRSSEDNAEPNKENVDTTWLEDIPSSLTVSIHQTGEPSTHVTNILQVNRRNLNPSNELKKRFGAKIVQNEASKRRIRGHGFLKATCLVIPRETWPPAVKTGLTMRCVGNQGTDSLHFTYEHNPSYQNVQMKFFEAVDSLIPDNIVAIINSSPYHVDALLQLSDMCRMSEDLQMAAELNERALYCLECAFHPNFNVATGNCRLDYRRQENRALFIALLKHLHFVGQRACYRTALELCKLLLSLDPEGDPVGVLLCIDFYALRCQKYDWFVAATDYWEANHRNVSQLPNFAFSYALSKFHLAEAGNEKSLDAADALLQAALIMFPGVLVPLLEKCSVQADVKITSHPYFSTHAKTSQSPSLGQLVQLLVSRNYHLWKDKFVLDWLMKNACKVIQRVDAKDPFVDDSETKRQRRYPGTPRNVLRHIVLSDIKEVTALVSLSSEGPMFSFDPLPPVDAINLYKRGPRPRMYERSSALSMFFRSLMPTFNPNEPAEELDAAYQLMDNEGAVADAAGEAAAAGLDLRRSVTSLLDAMRDLLTNIHLPDVPSDADVDDSEEEERH